MSVAMIESMPEYCWIAYFLNLQPWVDDFWAQEMTVLHNVCAFDGRSHSNCVVACCHG